MLKDEAQVADSDHGASTYGLLVNGNLEHKLDLLLSKVESLERKVSGYEALIGQVPGLLALFTDTVDGLYKDAAAAGIDPEARLKSALILLEKLSQPEVVKALQLLTQNLPMVAQMLQQAPGLAAMTLDTLDELYAQAKSQGVDLESMVRGGLKAAQVLLESGVFDPQTIQVIGNAGYALVESQKDSARVGLFGLLRSVGDPDVQRTLQFLTTFARHFGKRLNA
jgi:uncharacterized protein YjgD (DUF1641 family)